MAIGDQVGLQAVEAAKAALPGLEDFLKGREDQLAAVVNSVIAAEQALVPQLQSAVAADLGPVVEQLAAFNNHVAILLALIQRVLDEGIALGGKRS